MNVELSFPPSDNASKDRGVDDFAGDCRREVCSCLLLAVVQEGQRYLGYRHLPSVGHASNEQERGRGYGSLSAHLFRVYKQTIKSGSVSGRSLGSVVGRSCRLIAQTATSVATSCGVYRGHRCPCFWRCTSWFKHTVPTFVTHECRLQYRFKWHIFVHAVFKRCTLNVCAPVRMGRPVGRKRTMEHHMGSMLFHGYLMVLCMR